MKTLFNINLQKILVYVPLINYLFLPLLVYKLNKKNIKLSIKLKIILFSICWVVIVSMPNIICAIFAEETILHDIVFYITLYIVPISVGMCTIKFQKDGTI